MRLSFFPSRFSNMEIQRLFKILKSLTSQTNVRDLIASFQGLLSENFEQVDFTVYELQAARIDDHKSPCLYCLDCELEKAPFLLHEHQKLNSTFLDLEPNFYTKSNGRNKAIFPVVLYDNSVSHLISVSHEYDESTSKELLLGLLEIFTDIFRSIHEKGYDPLTRILNRQAFDQTASELAYSENYRNHPENSYKAIAILDIDKFKEINDIYGHAIGDETLVLFAQTIRSVLRQEDLFFRYGGEEFVIFVKGVEQEQAQQVLERCRMAIESRRFPQVGRVTVSIGFTDLDEKLHPVANLSKADKALYYIKNNGRNQALSYERLLEDGLLEAISVKEGAIDFWD